MIPTWPIGVFARIDNGFGVHLEVVHELGLTTVHLLTPSKEYRTPERAQLIKKRLEDLGISISTLFLGFQGESYQTIEITAQTIGFVPKETRVARLAEAKEIAAFAHMLDVRNIGSHIGFIPHDKNSMDYHDIVLTIRELCDELDRYSQELHLETGQEAVDDLMEFMTHVQRDNMFINFDPANLILYGVGNPIEALRVVGPRVRGVHCKDAIATSGTPGVDWGKEVPFGQGQVDAELFLQTLKEIGYRGTLTIEREIPEEPERQKAEIGQAVKLINELKRKIGVN